MKKSLLRLAMLGLPVMLTASCGVDQLFGLGGAESFNLLVETILVEGPDAAMAKFNGLP